MLKGAHEKDVHASRGGHAEAREKVVGPTLDFGLDSEGEMLPFCLTDASSISQLHYGCNQ